MTNAFSKPLFLVEDDTDDTLVALLSGALVYKIAKATRAAVLSAAELLWTFKSQWQYLIPDGLLKIFPAFDNQYESKKNLEDHVQYTNDHYQFTDSRKDLVSKKVQHLANIGAYFFKPMIRAKAASLSEDDYFDVGSAMLRHVVTADFEVTDTLVIAPPKNFEFGCAKKQTCRYVDKTAREGLILP